RGHRGVPGGWAGACSRWGLRLLCRVVPGIAAGPGKRRFGGLRPDGHGDTSFHTLYVALHRTPRTDLRDSGRSPPESREVYGVAGSPATALLIAISAMSVA